MQYTPPPSDDGDASRGAIDEREGSNDRLVCVQSRVALVHRSTQTFPLLSVKNLKDHLDWSISLMAIGNARAHKVSGGRQEAVTINLEQPSP
jgi:hypothetical protein